MARLPSTVNSVVVARHLDARLDPLALLEVLDVHVLDGDVAAIDEPQRRQNLIERRRGEAQKVVDEDRPVVIRLGEAIGRGVEIGMVGAAVEAERIERGDEVAVDPR